MSDQNEVHGFVKEVEELKGALGMSGFLAIGDLLASATGRIANDGAEIATLRKEREKLRRYQKAIAEETALLAEMTEQHKGTSPKQAIRHAYAYIEEKRADVAELSVKVKNAAKRCGDKEGHWFHEYQSALKNYQNLRDATAAEIEGLKNKLEVAAGQIEFHKKARHSAGLDREVLLSRVNELQHRNDRQAEIIDELRGREAQREAAWGKGEPLRTDTPAPGGRTAEDRFADTLKRVMEEMRERVDAICGAPTAPAPAEPYASAPADRPATVAPVDQEQVGGDHYLRLAVQPWDAMEAWMTREQFVGFLLGNAIKYSARQGKKGGLEDLKKAHHYLQKLIWTLERTD